MTGKQILDITIQDPRTKTSESIGDYLRDVMDSAVCDAAYELIVEVRGLTSEEEIQHYDFQADPLWKIAWNMMCKQIMEELVIR